MFTIYILFSKKSPRTYVGYTQDIKKRLQYHNSGRVSATKFLRPWEIIYTESVESEIKAKDRENYWKSGAGFPPRHGGASKEKYRG